MEALLRPNLLSFTSALYIKDPIAESSEKEAGESSTDTLRRQVGILHTKDLHILEWNFEPKTQSFHIY